MAKTIQSFPSARHNTPQKIVFEIYFLRVNFSKNSLLVGILYGTTSI